MEQKPPKKIRKKNKSKFTPEVEARVLAFIREFGKIEWSGDTQLDIGVCSVTVWRRMNPGNSTYDPAFRDKVREAFKYYRDTHVHPSEDPDIKKDILALFREYAKVGIQNTQTNEYDDDGRIARKIYKKTGVEKWAFEVAYPPKTFTEQAILTVTANQLDDLSRFVFEEDTHREIVIKWLSDWMRRAKDELHKQGLKVVYMEASEGIES